MNLEVAQEPELNIQVLCNKQVVVFQSLFLELI